MLVVTLPGIIFMLIVFLPTKEKNYKHNINGN